MPARALDAGIYDPDLYPAPPEQAPQDIWPSEDPSQQRAPPTVAEPRMRKLLQDLAQRLNDSGNVEACRQVLVLIDSSGIDDIAVLDHASRERFSTLLAQLLEVTRTPRVDSLNRSPQALTEHTHAVREHRSARGQVITQLLRNEQRQQRGQLSAARSGLEDFKAECDQIRKNILDPQEQYRALINLKRRNAYDRVQGTPVPRSTRSAL
jgi:hypothetical protein